MEGSGPATDRKNEPVIDPSKNAEDALTAATRRQDDLREEMAKRLDERFVSIEREFALIEDRRKEQKVDTKTAVDAALLAAKEAVKEQTTASAAAIAKSETSAAEQSRSQNATFTAAIKGVTDVLSDVKERVSKIETLRLGSAENLANNRDSRTDQRLDLNLIFAAVVVLLAVLSATHAFG